MGAAAEARVATEAPRRYLAQLCKHFQHKLPVTLGPVTLGEAQGRIEFAGGACDLTAEGETLVLRLAAEDTVTLVRLEDVVARHLLRFAFRDPPEISWTPVG
ncbi:MAG: 2,4-dihydroxyhept-2-ene,7-dioic acid aldolase [Belnapia sp.]|nr:2,4-dihydroxyhept-2-ene,7-dioic acid aldolase [Belnapia sp.]